MEMLGGIPRRIFVALYVLISQLTMSNYPKIDRTWVIMIAIYCIDFWSGADFLKFCRSGRMNGITVDHGSNEVIFARSIGK